MVNRTSSVGLGVRLGLAIATLFTTLGCSTFARPAVSNLPSHASTAKSQVPFPIVLIHGFAGFSNFGWMGVSYFNEVEEFYREAGVVVSAPAIPPYNSSAVRARYVATAIDDMLQRTGAKKVHIIGHSQGGLDARYLVNALGYGDRVATITTVSTPHHGALLADRAQIVPTPIFQAVFWLMAGLNGAPPGVDLGEINSKAALHTLSTEGMADFNRRYVDDPRVPIFSMAAVAGKPRDGSCDDGAWGALRGEAAPQLWLTPTWTLLGGPDPDRAVSNDGVITAASAKWGTFLGCIPADHIQVVGVDGPTLESPNASDFAQGQFFMEYLERLRVVEGGGDISVMSASRPKHLPKRRARGGGSFLAFK